MQKVQPVDDRIVQFDQLYFARGIKVELLYAGSIHEDGCLEHAPTQSRRTNNPQDPPAKGEIRRRHRFCPMSYQAGASGPDLACANYMNLLSMYGLTK
ncbi:hypothetical protein [Ensifer canadensis]|uniref:hypothetical protein n=1 Tax=Ensifer canadensis TaxID=555315 RepID=UPI00193F14CB|nr:hypothetical protein [Ensifer canadensis]UBI80997.1 hypothetical protein J3R84_37075 [Ensifer canadensis]